MPYDSNSKHQKNQEKIISCRKYIIILKKIVILQARKSPILSTSKEGEIFVCIKKKK
jgi:hypothetical protein